MCCTGEDGLPDVLTWVRVDTIGKHSFRSRLPIGLWGEASEAVHPNGGRDARHGWCSDAWRGAATWCQRWRGVEEERRQAEQK